MPDDDPRSRVYTEPADALGSPRAEVELPRGDVTEGVVRIGNTVRRPHQPTSLAVAGYLDHLERVGFDGAPRYLGRDSRGRDVLTFLEGSVAGDPPEQWATTEELLAGVAGLLRRLHEASTGYLADAGFAAPYGAVWHRDRVRLEVPDSSLPPPELVSHCDVTPQNVVVRDGRAVGLIDFDMAGPTSRLLDVVNTAMWWVPLRHPDDLPPHWRSLDVPSRLRLFVEAYGLDRPGREAFVGLAIARAVGSRHRMRAAAEQLGGGWARMWEQGVGEAIARREQWLRAHRPTLEGASRTRLSAHDRGGHIEDERGDTERHSRRGRPGQPVPLFPPDESARDRRGGEDGRQPEPEQSEAEHAHDPQDESTDAGVRGVRRRHHEPEDQRGRHQDDCGSDAVLAPPLPPGRVLEGVDGPYLAIRDLDGLRRVAGRSAALGFDGTWMLHPGQVDAVNEVFSPRQEDSEHAEDILDAYAWHTSEAGGRRGAAMRGCPAGVSAWR